MMMKVSNIISNFSRRGVSNLNPTIVNEDELCKALGFPIDQFFLELYQYFGGFSSPDNKNILLWSLSKIKSELNLSTVINNRPYTPIGDILIDSDFLLACLEDASAPTFLLYERKKLAESCTKMFYDISLGNFVF